METQAFTFASSPFVPVAIGFFALGDLIDQDIGDSFAELLARGCEEEREEESRKQRGEGFMRPPN
jgi:hypothetical protein